MRTVLKLTLVAFAVLVTVKAELEEKSVQFTESTEQRQEASLRERREADAEAAALPVAEGPWRGEGRPRLLPRSVRSVQFFESTEERQEASLRERREADADAAAIPVAEGPWRGEGRPRPLPRPVRSVHFSESTEERQEASLRERREAYAAAFPVAEDPWRGVGSIQITEPHTYTYNKWPRPIPRPV